MKDHTTRLLEALKEAREDVQEVLDENISKWGNYRKNRIELKKKQLAEIDQLIAEVEAELKGGDDE